MAQHDLKVKIRRIWKWTLIGIIIFLVVSFFLKSSYPITHHKFNFADAYDVLKDTLTLAAAFLAPVAAFVLFDDWRTSHRLKNNETEVIEILKKVKNIPFRAKDLAKDLESFYENDLTKQEIEDYENKAFAISAEILAELGNINFSKKNFVNIKFHDKCLNLYSETYKLLTNIIMLCDAWTCLDLCKKDASRHDQLPSLIAREDVSSAIFFQSARKFLGLFDDNLKEIDNLADEHRIR